MGVDAIRRRRSTGEEIEAALDALDREPLRIPAASWPGSLAGLDNAGLYSWWTDRNGAADLSSVLNGEVAEGRI